MTETTHRSTPRRAWRVYLVRDGREIERQRRSGTPPSCPCCGEMLEALPQSRLARMLPLDATAHDLACRDCRRFWTVVHHTDRSLRLLRMRRFAAAVRAVRVDAEPVQLLVPDPAA